MKLVNSTPREAWALTSATTRVLNMNDTIDRGAMATISHDSTFSDVSMPDGHSMASLNTNPIRISLETESETRKSGVVRILLRATAKQAREVNGATPIETGDEEVTAHTVVTIPAKLADKWRRGLIPDTSFPRLIGAALNALRWRSGNYCDGEDIYDAIAREIFRVVHSVDIGPTSPSNLGPVAVVVSE